MKRVLLSILIFIFSFCVVTQAKDSSVANNNDYQTANGQYNIGHYKDAINIWESIANKAKLEGKESAELNYNLGNAYFRLGDIAKARLYYERALVINPSDKDIQTNAAFAASKIEDKIVSANSSFFVSSWMSSIENLANSNGWVCLAMLLFVLFIIGLFVFFLTKVLIIKKTVFYINIILIIIIVFANIFAFKQKKKFTQRDYAIITAGAAKVMSSPDINSNQVFVLHAGTKVKVIKDDKRWFEIEIENGSVGWTIPDNLEKI